MILRIIGLGILVGSLYIVYEFETASTFTGIWRVFHWPAIVLTGLGPLGLVIMSSNGRLIWQAIKFLMGTSPEAHQKKVEAEAPILQKLSDDFYRLGAKAFDEVKMRGLSEAAKKVIERLSVRMPTVDIRELLEQERDRNYAKLLRAHALLGIGVRLAPSVGMLGTILGMVRLLSVLSDPAQLGPQISLALFTTFYGLFFSLAVWTPLQMKMERHLDIELEMYNQLVRWLEFMEKRKPADYFADTAELPMADAEAA